MADLADPQGIERLDRFFQAMGNVLGSESRRASFALYAMGLFGDGERKSVEPIAARASADPKHADAMHQRLHHFIADSRWSDQAVRQLAVDYVVEAMTEREPIETWIVDDTGFLKQGNKSVGVQRQYTGSAGKIANCQIGVSLSVATSTEHAPIDFELYLPEGWANDSVRRKAARIPDNVQFQTKPELALNMIRRAVAANRPRGVVLADSAYGNVRSFREGVRKQGLHYAVGVDPKTVVFVMGSKGRLDEEPISVRKLATNLRAQGGFRRCTWRAGTKDDLTALFALKRVVPAYDYRRSKTSTVKGLAQRREQLSLLIEWRDGETEPANFFLCSVPTRTRKQLVRLVMQRWRTERVYEDLKGELGLDHFEGRKFTGWHHHVSVALSCYAFIIAERVRLFPPSARRTKAARTNASAA